MRGLSGPSMAQLRHRTRAPTSAAGGGELIDGSRRSSGGKWRGKGEATEELQVGKIKRALPSHRCSQWIRVNGDRGGAHDRRRSGPRCMAGSYRTCVRPATGHPVRRWLRLTSGPQLNSNFQDFQSFEI
jgi:hypothetical protein